MREGQGRKVERAYWISLILAVVVIGLVGFPVDDGLRHVALAFGEARSWGAVYPFSIFELHRDYDPWYGYDVSLRALASVFGRLPVPRLLQQYLLAKLLSIAFMTGLLALAVQRAGIASRLRDGHSLALGLGVTALLLVQPALRFALIRPFAFGTVFLLYALSARGWVRGAVSAGMLCFVYPYLAWLYTLPAVLATFLRGSRSFAAGVLGATAVAVLAQPDSFWALLGALSRADALRRQTGVNVAEFSPMVDHLGLLFFVSGGLLLIMPCLPGEAKTWRCEHVLLLIFLLPSLKHVRYFLDVELPLLFVAYGGAIVATLAPAFERWTRYWRETGARAWERIRRGQAAAGENSRTKVRRFVPVLYAVTLLALSGRLAAVKYGDLDELQEGLAAIPNGSLILVEFNLQYELLFTRPDVRLVPSSELGFPRPDIAAPYRAFFEEGDVCTLAHRTEARFFLEAGGMYLDPRRSSCLVRLGRARTWRIWKVDGAR